MKFRFVLSLLCGLIVPSTQSWAVEGSTAAGPIGGSDIRAAQLPPPGFYGFGVAAYGESNNFNDGQGRSIPALDGLEQTITNGGLGFLYVPDQQVLGGSLGFVGFVPFGQNCGRLFVTTPSRCSSGLGDPYIEVNWSKHFGTVRASRYPGTYPISQGLTFQLGLGVVIPVGQYSASDAATNGVTIGNNIWDIAPMIAATYTTPAIIADGTEFSAKVYWNNYLENPETNYKSGSLLNIDFAVTERIGRFQGGVAGFYAKQLENDRQFGRAVQPDGRRAEVLSLGVVAAYDMPKSGSALKFKALSSVHGKNVVDGFGISITYFRKFF